jgi:hypothetical protein
MSIGVGDESGAADDEASDMRTSVLLTDEEGCRRRALVGRGL